MNSTNPTSRREFLRLGVTGAAGLAGLQAGWSHGSTPEIPRDILAVPDQSSRAPATPVAIARSRSYEPATLRKALEEVFRLTGGIDGLVRGKTVTVKLNLTGIGMRQWKMCGLPGERTFQVHPTLVEVLCGLLARAGARRIILVESYYASRKPEEVLSREGWKVDRILRAGDGKVIFSDTRNRGEFESYARCKVSYGGYTFPAYHLNRHYVDTDVFISLGKMKNHTATGITVAVKNLFGIAPTSLYGDDSPNEKSTSNRGAVFHKGSRPVPDGVEKELYADTPRLGFYRVPRITADLLGARPVDLAIVDAVETVFGGEGPWTPPPHRPVKPGLIVAGRNANTTDAVCMGVMGYDPQAKYGERPFQGENHLYLLARAGIGSNDLNRIEVRGLGLKEALLEFEPPGKNPGWVRRNLLNE